MEPIRIRNVESDFTYSIEDGRLKATGKVYLKGRQEYSFAMEDINPEPLVLEGRHQYFRQGVFVMVGAFVAWSSCAFWTTRMPGL